MKKRRFRLSRGQDTVLNLVLCALLLVGMWGVAGYPLPTAEMEFRRMERTHLLPPGEIVLATSKESRDQMASSGEDQSVYAMDGTELHLRGRWFASLGEDWAALAMVGRYSWARDIRSVPLEQEGAALLPFPAGYGYWFTMEKSPGYTKYVCHNFFPILLVDVPEETDRAEITVQKGDASVTGPGWNMGKGVWLLTPDNQVLPYQGDEEQTYTLRLRRADGSLLLERSGVYREE